MSCSQGLLLFHIQLKERKAMCTMRVGSLNGSCQIPTDIELRLKDFQSKIEALRNKSLATQSSERPRLAAEFNELQFEMMDLEEECPPDQVIPLKQQLDVLGKTIAGTPKQKQDSMIPCLVSAALSGAAFGLVRSAGSSLMSSSAAAPQNNPIPEPFDHTNVHHAVGRNDLLVRSVICRPQAVGQPLQMSEPIISSLPSSQPSLDSGGIENYLTQRGMKLADAKQCSVFLCSRKISVSDLEKQREALLTAKRAMEEAGRALEQAKQNTADAYRQALDNVSVQVELPPKVDVNGKILYDFPNLARAKAEEESLAWTYNDSVVSYGQQQANLSELQRKLDGDTDKSWFRVIVDIVFGVFGSFEVSRQF